MAAGYPYVELGITLRSLVKAGLLDLGGHEAARGSAEDGLASQSPAGSHGSDRRHGGSGFCVDEGVIAEGWRRGGVRES
jgi:hypothetical protein